MKNIKRLFAGAIVSIAVFGNVVSMATSQRTETSSWGSYTWIGKYNTPYGINQVSAYTYADCNSMLQWMASRPGNSIAQDCVVL